MEVWDDRRSEPPRRSRIRRFADWKDFALFMAEVTGLVSLGGTALVFLMTSMGFTFSGSGQAIAKIQAGDALRDSALVKVQRQNESFSSRLDAVTYLVCAKAKRDDRSMILPRECNRVLATPQEPQ